MNYKFKLANVEVVLPNESVNVKIGELSCEVSDLNVLDSIQVMKAIPELMREIKEIVKEDETYHHPSSCVKCENHNDGADTDGDMNEDDEAVEDLQEDRMVPPLVKVKRRNRVVPSTADENEDEF